VDARPAAGHAEPEPGSEAFREALKKVAVALKKAGVRFALAGGYAAWARGGPEPGHDVDFFLDEADVDAAVEALASAGLRVDRPTEDWLFKAWDGSVMVDLIHDSSGRPAGAATADAEQLPVCSIDMPVLSATDIVAAKLAALDEHNCDYGRLLPVVRALREQLDWPAVAATVAGNPFAAAFLDLAGRLGIAPPVSSPR
jgi:hypothetical protein